MRALAVAVVATLGGGTLVGCGDSGPPKAGDLEIGIQGAEGEFVPLEDEGRLLLELGPSMHRTEIALRAEAIDPWVPAPTVEIEVRETRVASRPLGERRDMVHDGVGYVLWGVPVVFEVELCCYVCRNGAVTASLEDRRNRKFKGSATAQLTMGDCPDPTACCVDDECPAGLTAQLCE